MVEGRERKEEAMNLLNEKYSSSGTTWNVIQTCSKVEYILSREGLKPTKFHGCHQTCTMHHSLLNITRDLLLNKNGYSIVKFVCGILVLLNFLGYLGSNMELRL